MVDIQAQIETTLVMIGDDINPISALEHRTLQTDSIDAQTIRFMRFPIII